MKQFILKQNWARLEFWAATCLLAFVVFFLFADGVQETWISLDDNVVAEASVRYYTARNLIEYTAIYLAFLLINFKLVPSLVQRNHIIRNTLLLVLMLVMLWLIFGFTHTYLKSYITGNDINGTEHDMQFWHSARHALQVMLFAGGYAVIKHLSIYLLSRSEYITTRYPFFTPGGLIAFTVWAIIMLLSIVSNSAEPFIAVWAIIIPYGILYHLWAFYRMIPRSLAKKRFILSYVLRTVLLLIVTFPLIIPIAFILTSGTVSDAATIPILNAMLQFLITMPLSWLLFQRKMRGNEEVYRLKKALGKSRADIDFLRSQINPHFMFNVLNTIYGTALQEGAERTAEAVQKLGDMMRFMLQENVQEKISLTREIDYLQNYISLQKLRIAQTPGIHVETDVEAPISTLSIAPMLLIPFVENAFKHGISFRGPSSIRIVLELKDTVLHLHVYNTVHERSSDDPEKNSNGIGLNNVKQRLELLYSRRHELIIQETKKDYFVHLNINLD